MDERQATAGEMPEVSVQPIGDEAGGPAEDAQGRPTLQQIADRVYELLCQDLRLERERRGRSSWRI